jgi:hypothetical protein
MLLLLVIPRTSFAEPREQLQKFLSRLNELADIVFLLVNSAAALAGMFFIAKGVLHLRSLGGTATQAKQGELSGAIISVILGACMLWLNTGINTLSSSIFGKNITKVNILSAKNEDEAFTEQLKENDSLYTNQTYLSDDFEQLTETVMYYVILIGYISVFRGWIKISHLAEANAQPGTFAHGFVQIVTGVILINSKAGMQLINSIFNFA